MPMSANTSATCPAPRWLVGTLSGLLIQARTLLRTLAGRGAVSLERESVCAELILTTGRGVVIRRPNAVRVKMTIDQH